MGFFCVLQLNGGKREAVRSESHVLINISLICFLLLFFYEIKRTASRITSFIEQNDRHVAFNKHSMITILASKQFDESVHKSPKEQLK